MSTLTEWTIEDSQRREMIDQIGRMNLLSISGGRFTYLPDGIELPVSNGYRVRVHLTPADDYTVERVFVRNFQTTQHGERTRVYCDTVGEVAYRAGMFRSYDDEEW